MARCLLGIAAKQLMIILVYDISNFDGTKMSLKDVLNFFKKFNYNFRQFEQRSPPKMYHQIRSNGDPGHSESSRVEADSCRRHESQVKAEVRGRYCESARNRRKEACCELNTLLYIGSLRLVVWGGY